MQEAIFRVIAAILHMGNIEFKKGADADSSEPKDDDSRFHLKTTAELLKLVIFQGPLKSLIIMSTSKCYSFSGAISKLLKIPCANV